MLSDSKITILRNPVDAYFNRKFRSGGTNHQIIQETEKIIHLHLHYYFFPLSFFIAYALCMHKLKRKLSFDFEVNKKLLSLLATFVSYLTNFIEFHYNDYMPLILCILVIFCVRKCLALIK